MNVQAQEHAGHRLLQCGIALFLLGLLTGLAVQAVPNPRMALSSHLEAVMNGLFLVGLGLLWPKLSLSMPMLRLAFWLAMYGTFANWLATLLASLWPAGNPMMPLAAAGHTGTAIQEGVLKVLLISLSLAMIALCAIVLVGLSRRRTPDALSLLASAADAGRARETTAVSR